MTTNEEIITVLQKVKQKIATKATWCRFAFATTKTNKSTIETASDACKWCLIGAIRCETTTQNITRAPVVASLLKYRNAVFPVGFFTLSEINDELGFDAVHKLLDYSIDQLQKDVSATAV